jgi:hypothetical protein
MTKLDDRPVTGPAGHAAGRSQFIKAVQESDLHHTLRLLLLVLACNGPADGSNRYQPNGKLGKACGLNERHIRRLKMDAIALGWLISTPRPGRSSLLQLALPVALPASKGGSPEPGSSEVEGGSPEPGGRLPRAGGAAPQSRGAVVLERNKSGRARASGTDSGARRSKPTWCGQCDETTRLVEEGRKSTRCPNCHPLKRSASGARKAS